MHIRKVCGGITFWFGTVGTVYGHRSVTIAFHPGRWKSLRTLWMSPRTNGAKKGVDNVLDWNMEILGFHLSYTDWTYWRYKEDAA